MCDDYYFLLLLLLFNKYHKYSTTKHLKFHCNFYQISLHYKFSLKPVRGLNNDEGGKPKNKVPNLEVYIISVWPSKNNNDEDNGDVKNVEHVPDDFDGLKAKLYDIGLSDKTAYDEKVSIMVSDYVKIVEKISDFAANYMNIEKKDAFTKDLKALLKKEKAQSKTRDGNQRTFASLLNGRFRDRGGGCANRDEIRHQRDFKQSIWSFTCYNRTFNHQGRKRC